MRCQDRLGPLHVRVAWQNDFQGLFASTDKRRLQTKKRLINSIDRLAAPKPQIGRDLIVSTSSRMKLPPRVADSIDQRPFDVQMDIFQLNAKLEFALLNLLANGREPLLNLSAFIGRN